jgi:serine/threonine-protein kinase
MMNSGRTKIIREIVSVLIANPCAVQTFAVSGNRARAEQILRELEAMAKGQYVSTTAFATIHLGLNEKEEALDWLEKSYEDQEGVCWYLNVDRIYDTVRDEPRFQALIQRVFGERE